MPRRYGKFRRSGRRSYGRAHHAAARSISRAWRIRKRRKSSLLARTALANRRRIQRLSKDIETKVFDGTVASLSTQYQTGLANNDGVVVGADGRWLDIQSPSPYPNGVFAVNLLGGLDTGAGANNRIGQWIHMRSLTLKYCLSADGRTADSWYGIMLVLDRQPTVAPTGLAQVLKRQTSQPFQGNDYMLAFQNLDTTGKEGRFKILYHKKHRMAARDTTENGATVPPITTTAAGTTPDVYGDTNRMQYLALNSVGAMTGGRNTIYGSITLKTPYKIQYGVRLASTVPQNQTIRLYAYQVGRFDENAPSAGGAQTELQWNGRFRFKDA